MAMLPNKEKDILCTIAAWADGAPTDKIRESKIANTNPKNDIVLLHSARTLKESHFFAFHSPFVFPRRFHAPATDDSTTTKSININMLSYNGVPMVTEGLCLYPNTPREDVIAGLTALYPGTLSWSQGVTEPSRSDGDLVYYKISTWCGSSGSGVFDSDGRLIGSPFCLEAS
jgi:hypothetical protein